MRRLTRDEKEDAIKWGYRFRDSVVARWYGVRPDTIARWRGRIRVKSAEPPTFPIHLAKPSADTPPAECVTTKTGTVWRKRPQETVPTTLFD